MKIHLLTISREKLHNHDFISKINYDKKTFFQEMSMNEEFLKNFANEIFSQISNKILIRNSHRRKVLDCLKKLNLTYDYASYITECDEINEMLVRFNVSCKEHLKRKEEFLTLLENDYSNSRRLLREAVQNCSDIYHSISAVNPKIYKKMRWYLSENFKDNTETKKLELVLSRIVSHAFTKTSPMGWLNRVSVRGNGEFVKYELKKNSISLNFVLLFMLYDKIVLLDDYIQKITFKLNPNFYLVNEEINIFGQRDNAQNHKLFKSRDCNVKVKNNPFFSAIINKKEKNVWKFNDVKNELQFDEEQTRKIVRKFVEIGLFRIDSYFSDEGDVLRNFIEKLYEIRNTDDGLVSEIIGIFEEIRLLMKDINENYDFELEKKVIELEKKACQMVGLEEQFNNREFIYKDNIIVKNEMHSFSDEIQKSMSKLMRLFPIFDVNTRIQQEVKMELERRYGRTNVAISDPFLFQIVANANLKYSNFWIYPWETIDSESFAVKKLDELKFQFVDKLLGAVSNDEVCLEEDFLDSLITQIPEELKDKNASYSVFYEFENKDIVINKIYPGYMSFYNRFLRYTDIIENYREAINEFYKEDDIEMAEIYETFGFNANSYHPIFDNRIVFDMTRNHEVDKKYKNVCNIYDTELTYQKGEFYLCKDEKKYKPVVSTSLMRVLYPGIITFYSCLFSNISHASDVSAVFLKDLTTDRVNVSPRISLMNIVLERRHWLFHNQMLDFKQNNNECLFEQVLKFLMKNNMPTRFFYQGRKKEYKELFVRSISVEFNKPQYFDIENIVLLKVFVNTVNISEWVIVTEALPVAFDADEYMTEFMV